MRPLHGAIFEDTAPTMHPEAQTAEAPAAEAVPSSVHTASPAPLPQDAHQFAAPPTSSQQSVMSCRMPVACHLTAWVIGHTPADMCHMLLNRSHQADATLQGRSSSLSACLMMHWQTTAMHGMFCCILSPARINKKRSCRKAAQRTRSRSSPGAICMAHERHLSYMLANCNLF